MRFPRRFPVLLFLLAVLFVLPVLLGLLSSVWFALALSPLQKQYLAPYAAAELAGNVTRGAGRSLPFVRVLKTAPGRKPELAGEADVVQTKNPDYPDLPLRLSPEARASGWEELAVVRTTERPALYAAALQEQFFDGRSLVRLMGEPAAAGAGLLAVLLLASVVFRGRFGRQSVAEERHGRRTKGPELVSARVWNREWLRGRKADGIRLRLKGKWGLPGARFSIPRKLEASHILLMGDTGSGKSNAIRQILRQVEGRGEAAVVYDPAGEFAQEFYRPERGDLLLNPLDERCPYWDLHEELFQSENADAIAAAMLPEREHEHGFFTDAPRRVLARLLRSRPSAVELLSWMANPEEIDERLQGTPQAAYLDPKAGPQRAGVLASLNMIADSLDLLPEKDDAREKFVTGEWRFQRTRWVFLTSRPSMRERILPLHSVWLDLLILRMMEPCRNPAQPVWFVLDELASLNKLPQLHTAVTENRKYGNPVVLGFQGRSQLEKRYGRDAEAMLSQPATKIFLKTSEPRAARWVSETLGEIEVERLKESRTPGLLRSKKHYAMEIATKPLVMASEIAGLEPLRGYVKQENRVMSIEFALTAKRSRQPEFIERERTMPASRPLPVAAPVEAQVPGAAESVPRLPAATPRKASAAAAVSPVEASPPLFAEPVPKKPVQLEPRRSAFRKEGAARKWTPVD